MPIIPESNAKRTTPTAPVFAARPELGTTGTVAASLRAVGADELAGPASVLSLVAGVEAPDSVGAPASA